MHFEEREKTNFGSVFMRFMMQNTFKLHEKWKSQQLWVFFLGGAPEGAVSTPFQWYLFSVLDTIGTWLKVR